MTLYEKTVRRESTTDKYDSLQEAYMSVLDEGKTSIPFDKEGKFVKKKGNKILAKIYDRDVFYKAKKIKSGYSHKYSMEISGMGTKEYDSVDDILKDLKKYGISV